MRQLIAIDDSRILVDEEDYKAVSAFRWGITNGYARAYNSGIFYMHRFIMGEPCGYVDHVNGNKLDNRRGNLRVCNQSQNAANSPPRTGKYKGVYYDRLRKKFAAQITIMGRRSYLGRFSDPIEAAKAYDEAALAAWGKFAYLNFGGDHAS